MTNQNELVGAEVLLEARMLSRFPAAEEEELTGYFREYGADPETAARNVWFISTSGHDCEDFFVLSR